ncbi:MAG: desulfoferrodoxin [Clostridia bacterium]|nr:desulfoferrodoxin [Clostridia bacterium]
MKENVRFYRCPICGNIVGLIDGDMSRVICCGRPMEEMVANTTDAAVEKHVPAYEIVEDEIVVKVGKVEHPMEKEHYIMWIAQVTDNRTTRVRLFPEQSTETRFPYIKGATLYAYCNKHGLWKTVVE